MERLRAIVFKLWFWGAFRGRLYGKVGEDDFDIWVSGGRTQHPNEDLGEGGTRTSVEWRYITQRLQTELQVTPDDI